MTQKSKIAILEFRQQQIQLFNIVLEHDECAAHRYFRI